MKIIEPYCKLTRALICAAFVLLSYGQEIQAQGAYVDSPIAFGPSVSHLWAAEGERALGFSLGLTMSSLELGFSHSRSSEDLRAVGVSLAGYMLREPNERGTIQAFIGVEGISSNRRFSGGDFLALALGTAGTLPVLVAQKNRIDLEGGAGFLFPFNDRGQPSLALGARVTFGMGQETVRVLFSPGASLSLADDERSIYPSLRLSLAVGVDD